MSEPVAELTRAVGEGSPNTRTGRVCRLAGLVVWVEGLAHVARVGDVCRLEREGSVGLLAEIVGFRDELAVLMPYGDLAGVRSGTRVRVLGPEGDLAVGEALKGRVIDAYGEPIDGKGPLVCSDRRSVYGEAPEPMQRKRISEPFETGVRAIDGLLTMGVGQRLGVFAGSGVGKSVLLGMIARHATADVNVIALLGERGREVREFIERDLGEDGLARSVVVVATGDEGALLRSRGAQVATTVAEYFRDQGRDVLFMMDSITRVAMAWREIGLAAGEPPATRGYPPSVFARMPRLLERAGMGSEGSITGLYAVLVEGDDMAEPVADTARSVLDGHIVLSRDLAALNRFPAIDILKSKSRVRTDVISPEHRIAGERFVQLEAVYQNARELIDMGAYRSGSNAELDLALELRGDMIAFLKQAPEESSAYEETTGRLEALHARMRTITRQGHAAEA